MTSTLFMLLYGDYPKLHRSVLTPLVKQPIQALNVRLWLNTVCLETVEWLVEHAPPSWLLYVSDKNVPKYRAMQYMFHDPAHPITTPWITWFDDDTIVIADNWFDTTSSFLREHPDVDFVGKEYFKPHVAGIEKWIRRATWFRNRAFQTISKKRRGIKFIQGSYWWIKTAVIARIGWPDVRLNHNGGDTALSEAVWQNGFKQLEFTYGVDIDCAERRGRTEKPAGATNEQAHSSDHSAPSMAGKGSDYVRVFEHAGRHYLLPQVDQLVTPAATVPPTAATPSASTSLRRLQPRGKAPVDGTPRRFIKVPPRAPKRRQVHVQAEVKPKSGVSVPPRRTPERTLKQLLQIRQQKQQRR